jgi:hypothetical protein
MNANGLPSAEDLDAVAEERRIAEATAQKRSVLGEFLGERCACGAPKQSRMSHCRGCYRSLPKAMQSALWRRFGEGYEEAFAASVEWLRAKRPQSLFDAEAAR